MPRANTTATANELHCKRQRTMTKCRAESAKCEWVTRQGCMTHAAAVIAKMETRPPHFAADSPPAPAADASVIAACKKYRSIQECNAATEGCHWETGRKCLPGRRDQVQGAPTRPQTRPSRPEVVPAATGDPAHIERCKAHKTINACNNSSDRCKWKPRLKCLPDSTAASPQAGAPVKPNPKTQHAAVIEKLGKQCLSMTNAITLEDYKDKELKYIRGIVQIGSAYGQEQKRHCFHYSVLYDWWNSEMLNGRTLTNPITREPVTDSDIMAVLKAKAAAERMTIDRRQPAVFVHFESKENIRYFAGGEASARYYFLKIVIWTCKASAFNRSEGVRVVEIGTLPGFVSVPTFVDRDFYNSKVMLLAIKELFESKKAFSYPNEPYSSTRIGEEMPVIPAIACLNRPSSEWYLANGVINNTRLWELYRLLKPNIHQNHVLAARA